MTGLEKLDDMKTEQQQSAYGNHCFVPMRGQPLHLGHVAMLEKICEQYESVTIGIGSANKLDKQNPYFAVERELILRYDLEHCAAHNPQINLGAIKYVHVPDFPTDAAWIGYLKNVDALPKGTTVLSGNPVVTNILGDAYSTKNPFEILKQLDQSVDICATDLRNMIAKGDENWKTYASEGTKHYFGEFGGKERITKWYEPDAKDVYIRRLEGI
jgi:nicotinamide-nucleotide adenylyltransferase